MISAARMAMNPSILAKIGQFLKGPLSNSELIKTRLLPDAAFATINAVMTPGDLDDKLIAGATDFALGAGSGLVAGGAARRMGADAGLQNTADMIASIAGGYASYPISMGLTRGLDKMTGGPGLTDFEKMAQKDQEAFIAQIQQQTLANAGMTPGLPAQYFDDNYLAQLGLA